MLPDFKNAKRLIEAQQQRMLRHLLGMYFPGYFHQASVKTIYEGEKLVVEMPTGQRIEKDISKVQANSSTYTIEQLKDDPELIYSQLGELAQELANKMGEHSGNTLMEFAKMNENVSDSPPANGIEMIFSMWERMDWNFDDQGTPNEHTFLVAPGSEGMLTSWLRRIEQDPVLATRRQALTERKRKLWYDRKNNRELVG